MIFLDRLRSHIGGLVCVTNEFYWYDSRTWDGVKKRVCMLLDFLEPHPNKGDGSEKWHKVVVDADANPSRPVILEDCNYEQDTDGDIAILLLVDGAPKWVWISKNIVEFVE
jgi:hypothetical protein